ncbi:hypothetical protein COE67_07790 [Priestia megaterium]|uniref:hypothetical protein n=1 Tax=Priestia megaterium TaxID=1404 RepID=UPI000BEDF195|nr:hypothetical protein [Priestia megaterium]PEA36882.1 hypothetical protein CON45_22010 [Priestia megaterium]PGX43249.1 hypothetical protein COE67_07790 [Priestia megaterium]
MKKVTSLSNDQFNTLIADKRALKTFMKHPQNEKIKAGWANVSGEQLQDIPSGAIYLTQSALEEEKPQVLLVSTDEKGQKQAYESDTTIEFLKSHGVSPVLPQDRDQQLQVSYRKLLEAHDQEQPQQVDSMLARVNAEKDYVQLKGLTIKEGTFTREQVDAMESRVSVHYYDQKQAKEQGDYQEDYKQELLQELEKPSDELQYKAAYKQQLLSQLGITQEKTTDKEPSKQEEQEKQAAVQPKAKEETPQEKEQRLAKMREFEQKHSFDKVYKLKKEVLQELKGLDLTDSQREKLTKLEKSLDTEKKNHDQRKKEEKSQNGFVKFFARKNGAHSKTKQHDSHEVER